jgi:hypothetical protein
MTSLVHLKQHVNKLKLTLEEAKELQVPFLLFEELEFERYYIRIISENWTAVHKLKNVNVPTTTREIKRRWYSKIYKFIIQFQSTYNHWV